MLAVNTKVKIIFSSQLSKMLIGDTVGRTGYIIEDLTGNDRKHKGYVVRLEKEYLKEMEWYFPVESVVRVDEA